MSDDLQWIINNNDICESCGDNQQSQKRTHLKHPDIRCNVCGDFLRHGECNWSCKPDLGIHAVHAVFIMCKSCVDAREKTENVEYIELGAIPPNAKLAGGNDNDIVMWKSKTTPLTDGE